MRAGECVCMCVRNTVHAFVNVYVRACVSCTCAKGHLALAVQHARPHVDLVRAKRQDLLVQLVLPHRAPPPRQQAGGETPGGEAGPTQTRSVLRSSGLTSAVSIASSRVAMAARVLLFRGDGTCPPAEGTAFGAVLPELSTSPGYVSQPRTGDKVPLANTTTVAYV